MAEKLEEAHQKVKECANMAVRKHSLGNYEHLLVRLEEKVKEALGKKLNVFNKIRDIEWIVRKRDSRCSESRFGRESVNPLGSAVASQGQNNEMSLE